MSSPDNSQFDPEKFSGTARLFPLPNLVLFPHVLQPLRVFEPRYCAMFAEALATDRLVAMAVLAPGWEADYEGRPPIHRVACLGRIATHVALDSGQYHALVAGIARVEIGPELPPTKSFRCAPATICADRFPLAHLDERDALERQLLERFRSALPGSDDTQTPVGQLLSRATDLSVLTDIVAYTVDFDVEQKAGLLAECDVRQRAKWLLAHLALRGERGADGAPFPPDFSVN